MSYRTFILILTLLGAGLTFRESKHWLPRSASTRSGSRADDLKAQAPGQPRFPTNSFLINPSVIQGEQLSYTLDSSIAALSNSVPGRTVPVCVGLGDLTIKDLSGKGVLLPQANTLAQVNHARKRFGRWKGPDGLIRFYNPEMLLVHFRDELHPRVVRVPAGKEMESLALLATRTDLEFAGLDFLHQRQFVPNDPLTATNQWHHEVIGSFASWNFSLGSEAVRIAIVDSPFQMDHPDLSPNTIPGWDAVSNVVITSSDGYVDDFGHATLGAGMAAAAINNALGVTGAANCKVLPININGFTSEMYNAVVWAATNGVRVVNISWDGGDASILNTAGSYLSSEAEGILVMAGVNGYRLLNWTNHPFIYCISMTDQDDQIKSRWGNHIDFAAPGWQIFSTSTNGSYQGDSGTSYSTPLFSGVVALLMSINPTLRGEQLIDILKTNALDLGEPGWDQYSGWGRIQFARSAAAAYGSLPHLTVSRLPDGDLEIRTRFDSRLSYQLYKTSPLIPSQWQRVTNVQTRLEGDLIILTDPDSSAQQWFYRVAAQ